MSQPVVDLRPKSVTDLVDEVFRIYRRNWRLFVGLGLPLFVPLSLLSLFLSHALGASTSLSHILIPVERPTIDAAALSTLLFGVVVFAVLTGLAYLVYLLAFSYAAAETIFGRQVTIGRAYRVALERIPNELLVGIKFILIVGVLTLLVVTIPLAIYVGVAWGMAFHVALFEGKSFWSATGASRRLVSGNWWRVVGMTLLVGIITSVLGAVGSTLGALLALLGPGGIALSGVTSGISSCLLQPITYTAWLLLYLDLRARKEGFDLALAAERLTGGESAAPAG